MPSLTRVVDPEPEATQVVPSGVPAAEDDDTAPPTTATTTKTENAVSPTRARRLFDSRHDLRARAPLLIPAFPRSLDHDPDTRVQATTGAQEESPRVAKPT